MPLVGQPYRDAITLRDGTGAPVSGATVAATYARRQDGAAIALDPIAESPAGSGLYPVSFTPTAALAHHLWLTATKGATFRQQWVTTVWPVTPAQPVAHPTGAPVEELLVLVDPTGTPVAGAAFRVVAQSVVAPAGDPFAPVVVAAGIAGAYLVRSTPVESGYRRCELATTTATPVFRHVAAYDASPAPAVPSPPAHAGVVWEDVI